MNLESALNYSHTLIKQQVSVGEKVVDATVGNGNDTVFLASLVGSTGHVYGFDVQQQAIDTTQEKLLLSSLQQQTQLIHDSHANIEDYVDGQVAAAVFNLGYLPGGDKSVITHSESTLKAIEALMQKLRRGGIICVVIYYGHPGGEEERTAVEQFAKSIDQHEFNVLEYQFINQQNTPPRLIAIQKR